MRFCTKLYRCYCDLFRVSILVHIPTLSHVPVNSQSSIVKRLTSYKPYNTNFSLILFILLISIPQEQKKNANINGATFGRLGSGDKAGDCWCEFLMTGRHADDHVWESAFLGGG